LAENQMNCFVEGSDLFTEKRMFSASGNVILLFMFFADFSLH